MLSIGTFLVTELMQSSPETSGLHMRIAVGGGGRWDGVAGECFLAEVLQESNDSAAVWEINTDP